MSSGRGLLYRRICMQNFVFRALEAASRAVRRRSMPARVTFPFHSYVGSASRRASSETRIARFGVSPELAHEAAPARNFPDVSQAGACMKNDAIEHESPMQPKCSHDDLRLPVERK